MVCYMNPFGEKKVPIWARIWLPKNFKKFQKIGKKSYAPEIPPKNASQRDESNGMQQVPDMLKDFRLLGENTDFWLKKGEKIHKNRFFSKMAPENFFKFHSSMLLIKFQYISEFHVKRLTFRFLRGKRKKGGKWKIGKGGGNRKKFIRPFL